MVCIWTGRTGWYQKKRSPCVAWWCHGWTCDSKGCGFESRPFRFGQVVHTHVPLSSSSIIWYRSRAVIPCGWEGNRRSGVALVMRHRLQWFIHLRAHGLRKGDEQFEHRAYAWSLKRYGTLYLYPGCELTEGGQGVQHTPGGWRNPPSLCCHMWNCYP